MYFIKRLSDDMWLMGYMRGACSVPTCIWGQHIKDAMPFDSQFKAEMMAKQIGRCIVVFRAVKEG